MRAIGFRQTIAIEIERVRVTPKALVAHIKGVTTREGAEALTRWLEEHHIPFYTLLLEEAGPYAQAITQAVS